MKKTEMETSVLLYAERCAVDSDGLMMIEEKSAAEEIEILKRWANCGYVEFGPIPLKLSGKYRYNSYNMNVTATHYIRLSKKAWKDASAARLKKANTYKVEEILFYKANGEIGE